MTNILLLIIIGYLAYKEIRPSFNKQITIKPLENAEVEHFFKEISKEEFDKEKSEREQLQKEFDNVMSYKIDDAVNAYKRGD